MGVVEVNEIWTAPLGDGQAFGDAGPYEVRRLRVSHRVDPTHRANGAIVDLALAERGDDGLVAFSHDVMEFRPVGGGPPGGRLLVDVVNRGRPTAFRFLNQVEGVVFPPPEIPDVGDGHLFGRGWTVWCAGWQHDIHHESLLGIECPEVLVDGHRPRGDMHYTAQPPADTDRLRLALPGHRPAPPVPDAPATLEETGDDGLTFTLVAPEAWGFDANGRYAVRDGGFRAGHRYRLRYTTEGSRVAGCGLLALRDAAAWARRACRAETTVLFGVSQCGRVIRHMLADGLVIDENNEPVFDGVMPVIAGGRLGQFNQRFANPGILPADGEGLVSPYRHSELLAPLPPAARPKVMAFNSSNEYWRGDAALVHEEDPIHADVRVHHGAGTQHTRGEVPQVFVDEMFGTSGQLGFSTVDYGPIIRALLDQLVDWTTGEAEPSPSCIPADGELATRATVLDAMAGLGWPVPASASFGVPEGPVPAVDGSGNEVGGIRLPDVAAPVGAHAGWNPRHPDCGAPSFQLLLRGASRWSVPAEIERRYPGGRDDYLLAVDRIIDHLVAQRLLLDDDRAMVRHHAEARWAEARAEVQA